MLWKKTKLFQTIIPQIYSKRSYKTINKYFYISSYSDLKTPNINQNDNTEKINELLLYINKKWKSMYPYTQHITIDKSMASYKGKISFKQYNKDKNKSFGIKFFTKASSDKGYVYHLLPYPGKNFDYDKIKGIGATIIDKFSEEHKNSNFHFTFDSYFFFLKSL